MECDLLDVLEDLGYPVEQFEGEEFDKALEEGQRSPQFTQIVSWLSLKLKDFLIMEEHVNPITDSSDSDTFMLELSAFLREIECPVNSLTDGTISERLNTKSSRLQLLDYLTMELASAMTLAVNKPIALVSTKDSQEVSSESEIAAFLKSMLIALGFAKPPASITANQLFSKVETKIKEMMSKNPNQLGKSLLKTRLSDKQWAHILNVNNSLSAEYNTRREMLLKRLDVTIQSFMWSDKAKSNEKQIRAVYEAQSKKLTSKSNIGISQMLAARDGLLQIQKTSSGEAREKTQCAINKVRIGQVPDRGGRAWEHEPPPPEMPAFQQRNANQGGGGGGGRGGGGGGGGSYQSDRGGRGGRIQGNWNDQKQQQQQPQMSGNWNQGGGGYQQGGYNSYQQNPHHHHQQQHQHQQHHQQQQQHQYQQQPHYSNQSNYHSGGGGGGGGGGSGGGGSYNNYGGGGGGGGRDNYHRGGGGGGGRDNYRGGGGSGGGGGGGGASGGGRDNYSMYGQNTGGGGYDQGYGGYGGGGGGGYKGGGGQYDNQGYGGGGGGGGRGGYQQQRGGGGGRGGRGGGRRGRGRN